MSRRCAICGKSPVSGNKVSHSHNVTKRVFNPNIQKVRIVNDEGIVVREKVCTRCLKAHKVTRV